MNQTRVNQKARLGNTTDRHFKLPNQLDTNQIHTAQEHLSMQTPTGCDGWAFFMTSRKPFGQVARIHLLMPIPSSPPITNAYIAAVFQQLADLTELTGGNRFKIIAFQNVVRTLEDLTQPVADMDRRLLSKIQGIGSGTAGRIAELLDTGRLADLDALLDEVPHGLLAVMDVPGLGPKTVALLWRGASVTSVEDLKAKAESGELETLKGFGKKKSANILKNLAFAAASGGRIRIGRAHQLATTFIQLLGELPGVEKVQYAGSLRRGRETIGDVDLLCAALPIAASAIFDAFVSHAHVSDVLLRGDTKCSVRMGEGDTALQVDLRVVHPDSFGAALMYFTGSKEHNVKLRERAQAQSLSLNEYGLWKETEKGAKKKPLASATEDEVYKALGLAWVPPELREDRGEIALAEKNNLPALLTLADVKAELHSHTTASDGKWSIEENARAAAARGFHTVAITDHSKGQAQANGLSNERLEQHIVAIHAAAQKLKGVIRVLAGSEVDILADGSLDYPDELLAQLDIVVASPHAALTQEPKKATARLIKAIENPYVSIIGHPTGRIVNRREGLSPDLPALFKAAAERGVALEINANPYRLDLRDSHARLFIHEYGGKIAINTDAHGLGDLDHLQFGVSTARRAGATAHDVVNCLGLDELANWIASTRP